MPDRTSSSIGERADAFPSPPSDFRLALLPYESQLGRLLCPLGYINGSLRLSFLARGCSARRRSSKRVASLARSSSLADLDFSPSFCTSQDSRPRPPHGGADHMSSNRWVDWTTYIWSVSRSLSFSLPSSHTTANLFGSLFLRILSSTGSFLAVASFAGPVVLLGALVMAVARWALLGKWLGKM